jgi:hypothetical protein
MRIIHLILIVTIFTAASLAVAISAQNEVYANATTHVDSEGNCRESYNSCKPAGHPDACCPEDTSCAIDTNGKLECCPHNTICYSTDNPRMAFIYFSSSASRRSKRPGWASTIAALALGVGNWRRREW